MPRRGKNRYVGKLCMEIPTPEQLEVGYKEFRARESRDAMYKIATFLLCHYWGQPAEMANSLGVLLLTWNQAHYRFGRFDFEKLEECIAKNIVTLEGYRAKTILEYAAKDNPHIMDLFEQFLAVLAIAEGTKNGARSPVAVAKALHLLAPGFFPLWDKKIAQEYCCDYSTRPAEKYVAFVKKSQCMARRLQSVDLPAGKTLLKLIDEYNYAKYTKGWVPTG
jgi:hypothetical protein